MGRRIYAIFSSLDSGLWLMGGMILLLAWGSFSQGGEEMSSINAPPLFRWLTDARLVNSWWLWAAMALSGLLAMNTVLCSIESVRRKAGTTRFPFLVAPQIMHTGFILIIFAHLLSARGGYKQIVPVREGGIIVLADGSQIQVSNVAAVIGSRGFPIDYSAAVRTLSVNGSESQLISPNHPYFHQGNGYYLKEVELEPERAALIEIHREPGAGMALAGAVLFTAGNLMLLGNRRGREDYS